MYLSSLRLEAVKDVPTIMKKKCWNSYTHVQYVTPFPSFNVEKDMYSVVCQSITTLTDGEGEGGINSIGVFLVWKHKKCNIYGHETLCVALLCNMPECSKDFFPRL